MAPSWGQSVVTVASEGDYVPGRIRVRAVVVETTGGSGTVVVKTKQGSTRKAIFTQLMSAGDRAYVLDHEADVEDLELDSLGTTTSTLIAFLSN